MKKLNSLISLNLVSQQFDQYYTYFPLDESIGVGSHAIDS